MEVKKYSFKHYISFTFILLICLFLMVGCSSSSSSSSSESTNYCGDTTSEHYAKTRKCNAKDNSRQDCTYSGCSCTCRPK